MKRISLTLFFILVVLWGGFSTEIHAADNVTVVLDWFVNPDHGPLFVALEKGFFNQRGLEVEFQVPSNPNDPPKLVSAKKADIAVSYQPQHYLHVDQGLPVVRIATLIATPLNTLVVLADSDIKSIADLKGKTVGYSIGGFETVILKAMLHTQGLSLDDIKLVNVNFSLSPSLFSGATDAVIGAYRNFELNQMDIEGRPGRAFFVEEYGIPPYDELILVAHHDNLKK
ncbi:MAG: ABC transporter substrate-binding protein, partial [Deltaproteobacteria bacterium]